MRKHWPCPSRQMMRRVITSKKSFKMLPYGTIITWEKPKTEPIEGDVILRMHRGKGESLLLVYVEGKESIHNSIIVYLRHLQDRLK